MKGQTSVEVIVIMAVLLVVVGTLIISNQNLIGTIRETWNREQARKVVEDVAAAATMVYRQSEGAKTVVLVEIPENVESSQIASNMISLDLGEEIPVYETVPFSVVGSLPIKSGKYYVEILARKGYVQIASGLIHMSTSSLSFFLESGTSGNESVSITSISGHPVNVMLTLNLTGIDVSVSESSFTLNPNEQRNVSVVVQTGSQSGVYIGKLNMQASGLNETQNTTITLSVIVNANASNSISCNIYSFPLTWILTNLTSQESNDFTICNDFDESKFLDVTLSGTGSEYTGFDNELQYQATSISVSENECESVNVYVNSSSKSNYAVNLTVSLE